MLKRSDIKQRSVCLVVFLFCHILCLDLIQNISLFSLSEEPCVGVSKSGSVECRSTSSASGDPAANWNTIIGGVNGRCVDIKSDVWIKVIN